MFPGRISSRLFFIFVNYLNSVSRLGLPEFRISWCPNHRFHPHTLQPTILDSFLTKYIYTSIQQSFIFKEKQTSLYFTLLCCTLLNAFSREKFVRGEENEKKFITISAQGIKTRFQTLSHRVTYLNPKYIFENLYTHQAITWNWF